MNGTLKETSIIDRLLGIEKALNWHKDNFSLDEINQFLVEPTDDYDFNCFTYPLQSRVDVKKAIAAAHNARDNPDAPWFRQMCECGSDIILTHREIDWYQAQGYGLPTLCHHCLSQILKEGK